jgi:hypothetical protein
MRIVTSKTYQAIANDFTRRGFLKLSAAAGVGAIIYSEFGVTRVCLGQGFGWMSLLKYFGEFALSLGMEYLGSTTRQYLSHNPKISAAFTSFTRGLTGQQYSPDEEWRQIGGYNLTFFAIQSTQAFMLPFFDIYNASLGSPVKWFTGLTMPLVDNSLRRKHGLGNDDRADYLLPREPKGNTANDVYLPEAYVTKRGFANYEFQGDHNSGEVKWTVYAREKDSDIQMPIDAGTSVVALHRNAQ